MNTKRRISKAITFCLTLALVIFSSMSAFAADIGDDTSSNNYIMGVSIDKTEVAPGESFTITYTKKCTNPCYSGQAALTPATGKYTEYFSDVTSIPGELFKEAGLNAPDRITTLNGNEIRIIYPNGSNVIDKSGELFSITCTIKDDAPSGTFSFTSNSSQYTKANSNRQLETFQHSFQLTIKGSEKTDPAYTITPVVSDTAKYVGDTFDVKVNVSADQADAGLSAADAFLNYDKTLVRPTAVSTQTLTEGSALYYTDGTNGVTADGTGVIKTYGDSVLVGESGVTVATYTFEAIAPGDASFSIADGAKVGQSGNPADIAAASGDPAVVTISETPSTIELISNDQYKGAPTDYQVLRYTANALPAEGSAYFYGDSESPLLCAGQNDAGKYVFLGFVDSALTNDTLAAVTEKEHTDGYITVAHDGDVNLNGTVNAIDALIAYDLSNGNEAYLADASFESLSIQSRLEADVDNDGCVDAKDARAVIYKALNIDSEAADPAA